jgi:cephalosporin-C deacetylase-like acetyl esterase
MTNLFSGIMSTAASFGALLVLTGLDNEANAMNHNLAVPWGDKCSPPQTPYLSFHSPQSDDLLFDSGDKIEIVCQSGLRAVGLKWSLHRNMVQKPFREGLAEAQPANRFFIPIDTAGLPPGFYDLRVELDTGLVHDDKNLLDKRPVTGVCTFGWQADKMAVADTRPADFRAFWDAAKAKLAKVPLDAKEGPMQVFGPEEINAYNVQHAALPPDYDPEGHRFETVESCKVDFAGPDGGRVYGWLAKPAGPEAAGRGKFPAMLVLPGAGFAARPRPLEHARHGYVALDIQVHGQDVDLPEYAPVPGYADRGVTEPAAHYYHNVHLRCLQAVNYLLSRPDVDPERLVVVGGSQGGRLGLVTAGLDPRVKAVVSCIVNSPNQPHLAWVSACNAAKTDGMDLPAAPPVTDTPEARSFAYYDPMNYAPDILCPVMMNAGLIDPISPPFSVWAVYNRLGSDRKAMVALDGLGHDWSAEFDRRAWRWLEDVLPEP